MTYYYHNVSTSPYLTHTQVNYPFIQPTSFTNITPVPIMPSPACSISRMNSVNCMVPLMPVQQNIVHTRPVTYPTTLGGCGCGH